jgi:hypothetical protein
MTALRLDVPELRSGGPATAQSCPQVYAARARPCAGHCFGGKRPQTVIVSGVAVRRIFCLLLAAGLLGLAMLFALAFHERYWRWRDCFNELGRCFDPESESVMTDAAFVWGVMAAVSFGLSVMAFLLRGRRSR